VTVYANVYLTFADVSRPMLALEKMQLPLSEEQANQLLTLVYMVSCDFLLLRCA